MDTGLDQDKTELAVHVLAVTLKVLADGDGLVYMLISGCSSLFQEEEKGVGGKENTFLIRK